MTITTDYVEAMHETHDLMGGADHLAEAGRYAALADDDPHRDSVAQRQVWATLSVAHATIAGVMYGVYAAAPPD
jgi:hypothetical protein